MTAGPRRPAPRRLRYWFESDYFRGVLADVLQETYDVEGDVAAETAAALTEKYAVALDARKGFAQEDPEALALMAEAAHRVDRTMPHEEDLREVRLMPHERDERQGT